MGRILPQARGAPAPSGIVRRMFVLGKVLEVAGMLTVGVALFVYGLAEENMNAELGWLMCGAVIFLAGYALERRAGGRR